MSDEYSFSLCEASAEYLDLADKRAGGKDKFFKLVRDNWTLASDKGEGAAPPATNEPLNK